jgi:hypothetical protein
MCEPDALRLALHQESHDVHVDEAHFTQIQHNLVVTFLFNKAAKIWQMLGADSSAQGQRRRS